MEQSEPAKPASEFLDAIEAAAPALERPLRSLLTVDQVAKRYPVWSEASLRNLIFYAQPRAVPVTPGKRPPKCPNGLASAIIRIGRKVLIDEAEFLRWVDAHRESEREEART